MLDALQEEEIETFTIYLSFAQTKVLTGFLFE
jgi:hypothetical protein